MKLVYKRPRAKTSSEGTSYFKLEDRAFSLSVFDLCDIYGFKKADKVKFPTLRDTNIFWDEIAVGDYLGSKAKAAQVSSPVLRYALKVMRNTIFARKDKCSEKRRANLLFQGLKHMVRDGDGNLLDDVLFDDINLGCLFASELVHLLFIGGVLTPPLFRKVEIPLEFHYQESQIQNSTLR